MVDVAARQGTELQNHRRHFSNQNDYHASFGAWRWDDLAQAHAELGRLRLDSFLFDKVVLTDSGSRGILAEARS